MSDTKDCAQLMRAALGGDQQAYAELLAESARLLRPYLIKRMANRSDIEDVLQEILISVHKARHTYDGKRRFGPWLYAIAQYRLADALRKHYADPLRRADELEEAENIAADDVTKSGIDYESVSEAIEQLPGKQPVILRLLHKEGYTAKEVGKQMGMTESAVKVAAHRAYKVLRDKLGES